MIEGRRDRETTRNKLKPSTAQVSKKNASTARYLPAGSRLAATSRRPMRSTRPTRPGRCRCSRAKRQRPARHHKRPLRNTVADSKRRVVRFVQQVVGRQQQHAHDGSQGDQPQQHIGPSSRPFRAPWLHKWADLNWNPLYTRAARKRSNSPEKMHWLNLARQRCCATLFLPAVVLFRCGQARILDNSSASPHEQGCVLSARRYTAQGTEQCA